MGEVTLFDGVGVLARGDTLLIAYGADASLQRARWLHNVVEAFSEKCPTDFVVFMVIPSGSKPPDQTTRSEDAASYARLMPRVRRLVVVPEGTGFRASLVRLVVGAFVTVTGKHTLVIATNVEQGLARIQEKRSALTPSSEQLSTDLESLRVELATSYPRASHGSAARLFGK